MTARLTTICLLFVGCSSLYSSKKSNDFTAEDRKFFKEAEAEVDASMEKPAKGGGLLAMGQFYLEVRRYPLAERMFQKAIDEDRKCVAAYAGLAKCHAEQNRIEEAAAQLDKAFAIDPKSPVIWNEAAVLRAKSGDLEGAVEAIEKAIAAAPNEALYSENLGNFLAVSGEYKRAFEVYVKSLNPGEAHCRIGLVMKDKGDMQGAERHLKLALSKKPDHTVARRMLASMAANDGGVQRVSYESDER